MNPVHYKVMLLCLANSCNPKGISCSWLKTPESHKPLLGNIGLWSAGLLCFTSNISHISSSHIPVFLSLSLLLVHFFFKWSQSKMEWKSLLIVKKKVVSSCQCWTAVCESWPLPWHNEWGVIFSGANTKVASLNTFYFFSDIITQETCSQPDCLN